MNWMDIKSREECTVSQCQCCFNKPGKDGFFKDYRELKDGSIKKIYVCSVCLGLRDSLFWRTRMKAQARNHMTVSNPLIKAKSHSYSPWRFSRRRTKYRTTRY